MEVNECDKIEEIVARMAQDYAKLVLCEGSQKAKLKSSLEEGVSMVEHFVDVADVVRKSNGEMMGGGMLALSASVHKMQEFFDHIDKLEAFVGMVKKQVGELEERLTDLEGRKKKYSIPFLSNKKQTTCTKPYEPIEIFNADLYFNYSTPLLTSSSSTITTTSSTTTTTTTSSTTMTTSTTTPSTITQLSVTSSSPSTPLLSAPPSSTTSLTALSSPNEIPSPTTKCTTTNQMQQLSNTS